MVFVDFSNPFLQNFLKRFCASHAETIGRTCASLPAMTEKIRKAELEEATRQGRMPRPLAAVVDIDEVLLSNVHENVYREPPAVDETKTAPPGQKGAAGTAVAAEAPPVAIHAAAAPKARSRTTIGETLAEFDAATNAAMQEPSQAATRKISEMLDRLTHGGHLPQEGDAPPIIGTAAEEEAPAGQSKPTESKQVEPESVGAESALGVAEPKQAETEPALGAAEPKVQPFEFHACDFFRGPDGKPWPRGERRLGPALPGAHLLLSALRSQGLEVFLVSGRLEALRAETVENLEFVGLAGAGPGALLRADDLRRPGLGGNLVLCPSAAEATPSIQPWKERQRLAISATHRVAYNIGDQASDFGRHSDVDIFLTHPLYYTP